ncbi:MAG: CHASE domain-containing protein [Geothrix sp.]|uniref:CHASE domain-containing protein n=1 Tax=Geothrix sp. TaxID=1962974 RepID=UPI0017A2CE40|nr:CHASE domain-containing protein [Geothrix sp.]NWJ40720.1 CHASE domain-containing protein [Geothrix sp.]WIL21273.1 MAG: CHASE domain-containing protein [Geothrix sp.]
MTTPPSHLPFRGRLGILGVLLVGIALSTLGFFSAQEANRRQVEAAFHAAARDRTESVIQGLQHGFEDVAVLRSFFQASDEVTRKDFDDFLAPLLARHPYIQAFQWLPKVTPQNRAALEAEARRLHPGFRFFERDAAGNSMELPSGASFYGIHFVAPFRGNEVTLGYVAQALATRQEALARALRTDSLAASGRIRLIQETGDQSGVLVMIPVRGKDGQPLGVVQGVFRMGDLVQKSMTFLEPQGVALRLFDASAPAPESLLHEETSPLPPVGPTREDGLRLSRAFSLAGRNWLVTVTPVGGHFALGTSWRAWAVLVAGLAFSSLLAGYVRTLLASEADIRTQVESRTQELAQEMESHRLDAQALRESEARFRHLIEVMGEGLWVLDGQGLTTFVNRRMAEMLGYAPADMVGRSLFEFMTEVDVAQAKRNLTDRRDGHGIQHDFRFRRQDGGELWTIVTGTPVMDEDGQLLSVLGVITDITERRRQEQAQLQSQKLESLGILAGGIAHDFNNLLTAILGNISLAQLCMPKVAPAWPYLENMERAVQRATNLTRQMLAYSGKGRFVVGPLDLNQAVQELSHLLSVSTSKKVAIRFQLQENLPTVIGEASQIQQVVMNLVTNAAEAIGEAEGIVSIRTGLQTYGGPDLERDFPGQPMEPGPFLTLEVSDTGQGMTPEVQARIFEPFFTTKFTGRGLGLSAMQGIVRGHRGGIRVYSEVGKGTTFKVIFPAGDGLVRETGNDAEGEAWTGSGTILVVDDEEAVRLVARDMVRSMGFEVVTAEDGVQALARFREASGRICAVLMDLTMPHMDGLETFRELRRLDPGCRVVLTSGYNEQEAIQDFLGKGLAAFVQKPFLRDDLLKALRRALEA